MKMYIEGGLAKDVLSEVARKLNLVAESYQFG